MESDRLSEAVEHIQQLASLGRSRQGPADNQAQQSVALKTIYTRTEPPSCGLPPKQNNTVQPQTQPSAGQGDEQSTTMSPRPRTSLAPNRSLTQMGTGIDPKTPRVPDEKATGLQTEIDAKADQRQGRKTSHDDNSSVPKAKPILRPSILTAENLPRMREGVPKEQEGQEASAKKDPSDIFGLGGAKSRSSSPFEWYKNKLVRPCKPEVMLQVLLSPRQLHHSCESLAQGSRGEGDGDADSIK